MPTGAPATIFGHCIVLDTRFFPVFKVVMILIGIGSFNKQYLILTHTYDILLCLASRTTDAITMESLISLQRIT